MSRFRSKIAGGLTIRFVFVALFVGATLSIHPAAIAQQPPILVETPLVNTNDSFFENFGIDFGFRLQGGRGPGSRVVGHLGNGLVTPNVTFSQGGAASAIPPFGNFDPNSVARTGFAVLDGGNAFGISARLGSGSDRSITSATPSVVVPNGGVATFGSGSFRPFVTGVSPVVGGNVFSRPLLASQPIVYRRDGKNPFPISKKDDSLSLDGGSEPLPPKVSDSTADQAVKSVEEIHRDRSARAADEQAAAAAKIAALIAKAEQAEKDRYYGSARLNYRKAIRLASEPLKSELEAKFKSIENKGKPRKGPSDKK